MHVLLFVLYNRITSSRECISTRLYHRSRKSRLGAKVGEMMKPVDEYCRRRFGMILAAKEKYMHEMQAKAPWLASLWVVWCVSVCIQYRRPV